MQTGLQFNTYEGQYVAVPAGTLHARRWTACLFVRLVSPPDPNGRSLHDHLSDHLCAIAHRLRCTHPWLVPIDATPVERLQVADAICAPPQARLQPFPAV